MRQALKNRIVGHGVEAPDQLMANPRNWRNHPKHQQDALEGALEELGWIQSVIVNQRTGHLVDGHLRVELAMKYDEPEIPVVYVDLTEDEELLALAIIDPISALATTDQKILDGILEGIDTENPALQEMIKSLGSADVVDPVREGEIDPDETPLPPAKPVTRPGDVWVLGYHRLICGDALNPEHIERLMEGKQADMLWTDPPYNVNYEGSNGKKIQNDNMSDSDFRQFLRDALISAYAVMKEGAPVYIAHADSEGYNFRGAMTEAGFLLKQCLIWVKNSFTLGRQDYQWQHEPILYGWKPGAAHCWHGEFDKSTVIDDELDVKALDKSELVQIINRYRNKENTTVIRENKPNRSDDHPTMKPVRLIVHMVRNSSRRGDTILDVFGGSGSTLIACEQIGRHACISELDPAYCDVIIQRYQTFTGLQAFLSTGEAYEDLKDRRRLDVIGA